MRRYHRIIALLVAIAPFLWPWRGDAGTHPNGRNRTWALVTGVNTSGPKSRAHGEALLTNYGLKPVPGYKPILLHTYSPLQKILVFELQDVVPRKVFFPSSIRLETFSPIDVSKHDLNIDFALQSLGLPLTALEKALTAANQRLGEKFGQRFGEETVLDVGSGPFLKDVEPLKEGKKVTAIEKELPVILLGASDVLQSLDGALTKNLKIIHGDLREVIPKLKVGYHRQYDQILLDKVLRFLGSKEEALNVLNVLARLRKPEGTVEGTYSRSRETGPDLLSRKELEEIFGVPVALFPGEGDQMSFMVMGD